MMNAHLDHNYIRQLTLTPILQNGPADEFCQKLGNLDKDQRNQLLASILRNNLSGLWVESIGKEQLNTLVPQHFSTAIQRQAQEHAIRYLQQMACLQNAAQVLERLGVRYAVFKGAHTRELVYSTPATRPSADIDILIDEERKHDAIRFFCKAGYELYAPEKNLAHEASLLSHLGSIDLHWHILRPGRVSKTLTSRLLNIREKFSDYYAFDDATNLFIFLAHPVFSEYCDATQTRLIRFVDLDKWITSRDIDWQAVSKLLQDSSLKTAAWITTEYYRHLTGREFPQPFVDDIKPRNVKRGYFQLWIKDDLSNRNFFSYPQIPKYLFTLPAHDTISGAFGFIKELTVNRG